MSTDIEKFIKQRKGKNPKAWAKFEEKYHEFALGMLLAEYRENAGLSLSEAAKAMGMHKAALSRLENHGEDVRFSTIVRYAEAMKKPMLFKISPTKKGSARIELQVA